MVDVLELRLMFEPDHPRLQKYKSSHASIYCTDALILSLLHACFSPSAVLHLSCYIVLNICHVGVA